MNIAPSLKKTKYNETENKEISAKQENLDGSVQFILNFVWQIKYKNGFK